MGVRWDRLGRAAAALMLAGGAGAIVSAAPAAADGGLQVQSVTIVPGEHPNGQGVHTITLSEEAASARHEIQITLPKTLADRLQPPWGYIAEATCTPGASTHPTTTTCTPYSSSDCRCIRIVYVITPEMPAGSFIVTAKDLITNETASGTVRIEPQADVRLEYLLPHTQGPCCPLHSAIDVTLRNGGPSKATPTLTLTFTGSYAFGTLPHGCAAQGDTITCMRGSLWPGDLEQFAIDLGQACGTFTLTGRITSEALDPNPDNNQRTPEPFENPSATAPCDSGGGSTGGSGSGGSGGSGGTDGGSGGAGGTSSDDGTVTPGPTLSEEPVALGTDEPVTSPKRGTTTVVPVAADPDGGSGLGLWIGTVAAVIVAAGAAIGFVLHRRLQGSGPKHATPSS